MIIVGYLRFRLKLNLEAILESKAIPLQKISSGHQNERSALSVKQAAKKWCSVLALQGNLVLMPV